MVQTTLKPPVIALVAGEASGDTLGADLMISLKKRYPEARFVGIGGPKMLSQGFNSWVPMEKLSIMGFFEVLKHLRELLSIRKKLIQDLLLLKPDVFIGIDAPDFNFKVEQVLKKNHIKTIHYVGPSVWAWREKRLAKIRESVDGVLVLFPFEPDYYHRYGIPVKFVGHPLAHQFPEFPDSTNARIELDLPQSNQITAILPGSRMNEINAMVEIYMQAAVKLHARYPAMIFIVPCVHDAARQRIQKAVNLLAGQLDVRLFNLPSRTLLEASDQVIVTSGTATLECALMKRPMVLAMKVRPISYWIMKKLSTTQWIGLPNILAGKLLVTELIQKEATAANIALSLSCLVEDMTLRKKQIEAFKIQYHALKKDASELASEAIQSWANLP